MDLRRVRYFVVLAEELHFSRAAVRLNIVQPALSQQTRQLEKDLGVRLFDRSSRQVALTDAGRVFLVEARRMLDQASHARKMARDAEGGLAGELVIGFVDNALWALLPRLVRAFRGRYPQVNLDLRQMPRGQQALALVNAEIDIGVLPGPVTRAGLVAQTLMAEPINVVLPTGHPLCALDRVPLSALADEPFVSFPSSSDPSRIDELIVAQCAVAGFVPRLGQAVQQMQTALALVSAGFGVAYVPPWMRRAWSDDVEYRELMPRIDYSLVLARNAERDRPVARHFEAVALEIAAKPTGQGRTDHA